VTVPPGNIDFRKKTLSKHLEPLQYSESVMGPFLLSDGAATLFVAASIRIYNAQKRVRYWITAIYFVTNSALEHARVKEASSSDVS
jgi:uncharacterized protein YciI